MKNVLFFGEAGSKDIDEIGSKGLSLVKLFQNRFPVPPGFIITSSVSDIIFTQLKNEIIDVMRCPEEALDAKLSNLQKIIRTMEFPEDVTDEILEAYLSIAVDLERSSASSLLKSQEVFVAVRTSRKNTYGISQRAILNVLSKKKLFESILELYASVFTKDLVLLNRKNRIVDFSTAVIVQKMIDSEKSGLAYSYNQEKKVDEIIVTACFGLGSGLSSPSVFPDKYYVDRDKLLVKDIKISEKNFKYGRDFETNETVKFKLGDISFKQVLNDKEIIEIARQLKKAVNLFESEQMIEWSMKSNALYIMQAKPILVEKQAETETIEMEIYETDINDHVDEEPHVIDTEDTLDDDLMVLKEIENIESHKKGTMHHIEEEFPVEEVSEEIEIVDLDTPLEKESSQEETPESIDLGIDMTKSDTSDNSEDFLEDEQEEDIENEDFLDEEPDENIEDDEFIEEEPDDEYVDVEEKSPQEEIVEEKIIEESIFSDYKDYDSFRQTEEQVDEPVKETAPIKKIIKDKFSDLARSSAQNVIIFSSMSIKKRLKERLKRYVNTVPDDLDKLIDDLHEYEPMDDVNQLRQLSESYKKTISGEEISPDEIKNAMELI